MKAFLTTTILAATVHAFGAADANANTFGSSTYRGVTTTVTGNGNGTRTVTRTDFNSGRTSQIVGGPRAPGIYVPDGKGGEKLYTPPAKSNVIGSSTYEGVTTAVARNDDGTHTVTKTDANGNKSSEVHGPKAPGIYVPDGNGGEKLYTPPAKSNVIGSSTYEGGTTTVTGNGDGTRTVTKTDASGGKSSQVVGGPRAPGIYVPDGNGGEKLYTPPAKSNVIGSNTYKGLTTVVTDNGDGTRTVTKTDANGNKGSEVHGPKAPGIYVPDGKGGEKLYTPPAKSNVIGSTTYEGVTTVVTDNGDGTHTVTTTDADGNTSSEVHQRGG